MKHLLSLLLLFSLFGVPATSVRAATVTIDKDVTICNPSMAGCGGAEPQLVIGNDDATPSLDGNYEYYVLIHFPVTGAAGSATLKLPLHQNGFFGPHGPTFSLSMARVTGSWTESTTWAGRPAEDANNRYKQTLNISTDNIPVFAHQAPYVAEFNVTNYVNDVANGTIQNHGLIIKGIAPDTLSGNSHFSVVTDAREKSGSGTLVEVSDPPSQPPTDPTPPPSTGGNNGGSGGSGGSGGASGSTGGTNPTPPPSGGTPQPTPTPKITTITNTVNSIKDLGVTARITDADMSFKTVKATKPTVYYYETSKVPNPGGDAQKAVNYTQGSIKVDGTSGTTHTVPLSQLKPNKEYFFTIVLPDGTQDFEHSFTTLSEPVAPISTPTPDVAVTPEITPTPTPEIVVPASSQGLPGWMQPLMMLLGLLTIGLPLITTGLALMTGIMDLPRWLLLWLQRDKKKHKQGRVYSSITNEGIPVAAVSLIDPNRYNRVIERATTLKDGTYAFLAKSGEYLLSAQKFGYVFPSKMAQKGYMGGKVDHDNDEDLQIDIPVDPIDITLWQRVALFLELFRLPFMILATCIAISFVIYEASPLNIFFLAYYVALWAWELVRFKDSKQIVKVMHDGKPVPFAVVRVKGATFLTRATNQAGEVIMVVPSGTYDIEVTSPKGKPNLDKQKLNRGFFAKTLTIEV